MLANSVCDPLQDVMDRISRRSQGEESVRFGDLRIASLLFADDVVLLATSDMTSSMHWGGLQPSVKRSG